MAKVITNLKEFAAKTAIVVEPTTRKYLNSDFLNTANYLKIDKPRVEFNYIDIENDNPMPVIKTTSIMCTSFRLPKNVGFLESRLANILYEKYNSLAKKNDKGINSIKIEIKPWLLKIRNYIYGNNNLIIDNSEVSYRKLLTRILRCNNMIAVNSQFGPANFIIISPDLIPVFNRNLQLSNSIISQDKFIYKLGNIEGFEVFVNTHLKDTSVLVGRKNSVNTWQTECGVIIGEYQTIINGTVIEWHGFVNNVSEKSKYMFDIINIKFSNKLSWIKKMLMKFLKYKNVHE